MLDWEGIQEQWNKDCDKHFDKKGENEMELCPYCDGDGENLDMARCVECDGTGILEEIECEESECWFCQGSGKDELDEMGVCKPCHGKGFQ